MQPSSSMSSCRRSIVVGVLLWFALSICAAAHADSAAYVRVNQAGYEAGSLPAYAYLMSTAAETGAVFSVINGDGIVAFKGKIGKLLGTWANSNKLVYQVYALDFTVPSGTSYTISVSGPIAAQSPRFAVDRPEVLYSGLLLNTLFFYETQRDGADFIPNALRTAPGHLKDKNAKLYETPPLDDNDFINNVPPAKPLIAAGLPNIDAEGGWWDAGDYEKYVETISYTTALMQIGVRDFPRQMGPDAPLRPPAPPNAISYAGDSGPGAPLSANFSSEARFGVDWLLKMWNDSTKTLAYQVDNSQDWNYYGEGNPSSASGNCGGTYNTPYCLITEYDIWTLPEAADNFEQAGDPEPCDPLTTYYICNRPVFVALPPSSQISPNLAGRLAADFALCYQLNQTQDPSLANQCLKNAEDVYALADLSYADPAPSVGAGSCPTCLLTIAPFDGYPETVWDDDMELGATELYLALRSARNDGSLPSGLPQTDPNAYLKQAAQFAENYITKIYATGNSDTLNLYDVSGLAHFELYRAVALAGDPEGLTVSQSGHSEAAAGPGGCGDRASRYRCLGLRRAVEQRGHDVARRRVVGDGQRGIFAHQLCTLRKILAALAGQHSGRKLVGSLVYRGRWEHLSELHSAPGGQSCRRIRWDLWRHADSVGRGDRGAGQLYDLRGGRWYEPVPGQWRRHL